MADETPKEAVSDVLRTDGKASEVASEVGQAKKEFLGTFTQEENKKIMRKVDRRFLFIIGMMYIIKNIDYQNAASAKVLQVGQPSNIMVELDMTANQYNWVQSIYFIAYIIFEVPSNLVLKKMTPRNWQSRIMLTWGIVLACHAAVQNAAGLYTARFFLGAMEAGMFPGIMAQLCSWYRSDEMGKPVMWMFAFQNTSGIFGSLIAYGVSYMNGMAGLSAWRWLYLLEGIFTMLFSIVVFIWLPDYPKSPRSQSWLTPREQEYLEARLTANAPLTDDPAFDKKEVITSLWDVRNYSFMLSQFLVNLGGYALSWQLPTVTTSLGYAGLPRNQLLNIPPAAATVLSIVFAGWFLKQAYITRPAFILIILNLALVFFVLLACPVSNAAVYVSCVLGTTFYSVYFIPFWAWRSSSLVGTTGTAFSLGFQNCIGQVGGVVAPQLFQQKYAYNGYKTSFAICAAAIGAGVAANCWTWWVTRGLEREVKRVRRLRKKAEREGRVFVGQDVRVFEVNRKNLESV
ncbi:permease of the major facilitator superfamily [Corynespora cassiicola Philippines]|uniref:Permease of the major facilitator superfamily n=1 Tax=Corynespora cassiicola Philippines TaxID=1448308 RepID=A0A2T2N285_CORCC|nr:permease of the major facilitator superfamily [Corynespora cassiicola Philippines]